MLSQNLGNMELNAFISLNQGDPNSSLKLWTKTIKIPILVYGRTNRYRVTGPPFLRGSHLYFQEISFCLLPDKAQWSEERRNIVKYNIYYIDLLHLR